MTSNTPSTENLPTAVPDADTYVAAFKDCDVVKVNLPAIPPTVQQRMDEINEIIASLLTTNDGRERLAGALETVRTFITSDAAQALMAPWARSNNTDDIPLEKIRAAMQRGVYDFRSSAGGTPVPALRSIAEINSGLAIAGWRETNISSDAGSIGLPSDHGVVLTIVKADRRISQYFYREANGDIYYRTWRRDSPENFRLVTGVRVLNQSAVDARVDALVGDATRLSALSVALEDLRGYLSKERINQLLASVVGAVAAGGVSVPENLLALSRNLQIVKGDNQVWHKLNPFPEANSALVYATILGAARFDGESPLEIDAIPDQSNTLVIGVEPGNITFYDNPNNRLNVAMPGFGSHIDQTAINIHRSGANSFLTDFRDNFIIGFDYALQRFLHAGENADLLRFGDQTAVMGLSQRDGLYFNIIGDDGYTRQSLLTGDDYGGSGDFNQMRNGEIQRYLGGHVIVEIMHGDDGYMKARAVIDGVAQNGGAFIDLRRTAEDLGIDDLTAVGAGNGMFIGNEAVSIARIYAIKNSRPLTLKQLLQIYNHRDNVGSIYYERRSAGDKYVIPAILQVGDANGNPTTLGGDLSMDLNADGTPKNYLTSPIISVSSSSNANQRTIPEMESAFAVVVEFGKLNDGNVLTDTATETVYDRRVLRNAHGAVGIWGEMGTSRNRSAYGFSFPNASTIRLDSVYRGISAGDSEGIHQIFLIRSPASEKLRAAIAEQSPPMPPPGGGSSGGSQRPGRRR